MGSWLKGPSFWGGVKTYIGENDWAPYLGLSLALWNGEMGNNPDTGVEKVKISALGLYFPVGIQYHGDTNHNGNQSVTFPNISK